jgi:hypothetical protein
MNTKQISKVYYALVIISNNTETPVVELIDTLTGYAWDEEDAGRIKERIIE